MISFTKNFSMNDCLTFNDNYDSLFDFDYCEKYSYSISPINGEFNYQEGIQNLTQSNGDLCNFFEKENESENLLATEKKPIIVLEDKNESIIEKKQSNKISPDIPSNNTINSTSCIISKNNKTNFLGRKRREDTGERYHSKYNQDNQMRKIKAYYIRYINKMVNSSLSLGHKKFLKIDPKVNENLKADYNVELMEKPLKIIFEENPINGRYSNSEKEKIIMLS